MMSSALKTRRKISAEAPLGLGTVATRTLVSSTKRILQAICLPEAPGASVLVARVRPWPLPRTPLCAGRCDERRGAETFVDIARFGAKKLALLRRFRPFRDGTP